MRCWLRQFCCRILERGKTLLTVRVTDGSDRSLVGCSFKQFHLVLPPFGESYVGHAPITDSKITRGLSIWTVPWGDPCRHLGEAISSSTLKSIHFRDAEGKFGISEGRQSKCNHHHPHHHQLHITHYLRYVIIWCSITNIAGFIAIVLVFQDGFELLVEWKCNAFSQNRWSTAKHIGHLVRGNKPCPQSTIRPNQNSVKPWMSFKKNKINNNNNNCLSEKVK